MLGHELNWNQALGASSPCPSISMLIASSANRHFVFGSACWKWVCVPGFKKQSKTKYTTSGDLAQSRRVCESALPSCGWVYFNLKKNLGSFNDALGLD